MGSGEEGREETGDKKGGRGGDRDGEDNMVESVGGSPPNQKNPTREIGEEPEKRRKEEDSCKP